VADTGKRTGTTPWRTVVIDKLMRARVVAGVAAAVLLASGVAVAATDTGSRPTVSREDATTSSTSVDPSTSTSVDEHTTTSTTEPDETTEPTTSTTVSPTAPTSTTEPGREDNHGACVSAAAHDTPPGPDHGKAVSEVAKSDCGKATPAADANENEQQTENEAPEQGNEQHGSQSGDHGGHGHD
jgi:hypothetical protein